MSRDGEAILFLIQRIFASGSFFARILHRRPVAVDTLSLSQLDFASSNKFIRPSGSINASFKVSSDGCRDDG